jgi:hypothetical protein
VAEAVKKKVFARSLKTEVTLPEDLPGLTGLRLEQRYPGGAGHGPQGRSVDISEPPRCAALIETGDLIALITATDASPMTAQQDGWAAQGPALRGRVKREKTALTIPHFELLSSEQLGLALGLENVIHAALTRGAAAQAAVEKARRLALYAAKPTETDTGRHAVDGDLLPEEHDERREIHG